MFRLTQDEERFVMSSPPEEGRDKCPYGPTTGYTALIIGKSFTYLLLAEFSSETEEADSLVSLQTSRCIQLPNMSSGALQTSAATLHPPH